jgi:hypothetical protein
MTRRNAMRVQYLYIGKTVLPVRPRVVEDYGGLNAGGRNPDRDDSFYRDLSPDFMREIP